MHLLGLSWDEFEGFIAVPWNEARLCGLLKETPTALIALFQNAKLILRMKNERCARAFLITLSFSMLDLIDASNKDTQGRA